jgi:putative addiction module component (TIGR02574 family)
MTQHATPLDYSHLSVPERILLVQQIWDSIGHAQQNLPVVSSHLEELHRRLDAFEAGHLPPGESWAKVRAWLEIL